MAGFKQHIAGGVLVSVIGAVSALVLLGVSIIQALVVLILGAIGSMLPDIDSDTSKPVQLLFGIMGVLVPVFCFRFVFPGDTDIEHSFCFIIGSYLFVQFVVSWIFFKVTRHRGIIHSIPAAIIAAELVFLIFYDSQIEARLLYSAAIAVGYLIHLTMDEIWSVDLMGVKLKKGIGSALSLWSPSIEITAAAYFIVVVLFGCCIWSVVQSPEDSGKMQQVIEKNIQKIESLDY